MTNNIQECKLCTLNVNKDHSYLKEYTYWHVRVTPSQHTLGCHVISLKRHAQGFSELEQDELNELIKIQKDIEQALNNLFKPDRFNYLQLGNVVRHLHFHLIPRYSRKIDFAGLEWSDQLFIEKPGLAPVLKQEKDSEELIIKLKEEIKKSM